MKSLNALKRDISAREFNDAEVTIENIVDDFGKFRSLSVNNAIRQNTSSATFNRAIAGNKEGPGMRRANDDETTGINSNITRSALDYARRFRKFTETSTPFSSPHIEELGELVREATDFCRRIISE